MDWEQILQLREAITVAIQDGIQQGFAAKEAEPAVTVNVPPLISMRDFFAGCALAGLASHVEGTLECDAAAAYIAADAMLRAREAITGQDIADTKTPDDETPYA